MPEVERPADLCHFCTQYTIHTYAHSTHSHICTQYTIHTYPHSTPFTHMHTIHHTHICHSHMRILDAYCIAEKCSFTAYHKCTPSADSKMDTYSTHAHTHTHHTHTPHTHTHTYIHTHTHTHTHTHDSLFSG